LNIPETVEHVVLDCPSFSVLRVSLFRHIRAVHSPTAAGRLATFTASRSAWEAFISFLNYCNRFSPPLIPPDN
jgi:hypothetical protein